MPFKTKLKASSIHLGLSVLVFSAFVFTLRSFWFPEPYFTASGGWQGLKIVAFIDIVLGPLLTFIVFNNKKPSKELNTDLSIILLLQLSALIWGINTVYEQRPIAITFWEDSFYTVPFKAVTKQYSNTNQLKILTNNPQQFYFVSKPIIVADIIQLNKEVQNKLLPPFQLIDRYKPINLYFDSIKKHTINMHEVISNNTEMKNVLMTLLQQKHSKINDYIYIPLVSKYQNIILIFNQKAELISYIKAPFKQ